jgi:lipoprotein-anchoring transpeptidase ErfK/SrfK
MGRTRAALYGFACAAVALAATPALAFTEIDPLTRQPLYTSAPEDDFRVQASPVPRQVVSFDRRYAPGTVVISTDERRLYLVLGDGEALQYGIGVGRPGFEWAGTKTISMKREWPDWRPPREMLKRRPDLPRHMEGGPENPLGARAMYLGSSLYRIHGSNEPETIGQAVSSGCIRMTNEDVIDLYNRVKVGTRVVVR